MKKRRKTIFLDQGEVLGGAERFLLDMLKTVNPPERNMINPVIIGAKNKSYRALLPEKVRTIKFDCPSVKGVRIFSFIRLLWASFALKKIIKAESQNYTVQVFANTPRMMLLAWALKFFWRMNVRLLIMVHDFTIPKFIFSLIAKQSSVIIVNSVLTRQVIRSVLNSSEQEKIMIVENGIDFATIDAKPMARSGVIKNVVLLGRIDPRKGQMFALEAARELQKKGSNIQISIIGSPFENDVNTKLYEQKLHQKAVEWNLNNVKFVPETDGPWSVFESADLILVLPTEPETFGRVVIEGLTLNKPVLIFDEMGPREIMRHFSRFSKESLDQFICEKDGQALAARLLFLEAHINVSKPFWDNGNKFVKKYYDQQDTKKQLVNILLES